MTAFGRIGTVLLLSVAAGGIIAATSANELDMQPPITQTVLYHSESVLGKELLASGENAGRIVDVLADESGRVRAAVVDFGGFLGVGTRKIAVAWSDLRFDPERNSKAVTTDLPPDRLRTAPEVKTGKPVVVISGREQAESEETRN